MVPLFGAGHSQKGVAERAEGLSATVALDYLEVPALLTVRVPSQGTLGAQLFLGPALSFEVDCHVTGSDGGSGISTGCKGLDLDTRTVDIGAVGGFGLTLETTSSVVLSIDALYNLGLRTIVDGGGNNRNRAFTIQAGVGFTIG